MQTLLIFKRELVFEGCDGIAAASGMSLHSSAQTYDNSLHTLKIRLTSPPKCVILSKPF